jgi:hypothetical protein
MIEDVVYACFVAAGLCFLYAFLALRADLRAQQAVQRTAETVDEALRRTAQAGAAGGGLGGSTRPQALVGADKLVESLARLGDAMARLRPGAAALLLAFGLLVFAGVIASVDDKIPDKRPATTQTQPARTATTPAPAKKPANGGAVAGDNGGAQSR